MSPAFSERDFSATDHGNHPLRRSFAVSWLELSKLGSMKLLVGKLKKAMASQKTHGYALSAEQLRRGQHWQHPDSSFEVRLRRLMSSSVTSTIFSKKIPYSIVLVLASRPSWNRLPFKDVFILFIFSSVVGSSRKRPIPSSALPSGCRRFAFCTWEGISWRSRWARPKKSLPF